MAGQVKGGTTALATRGPQAVAPISTALAAKLDELEGVVSSCNLATLESQGRFVRAVTLARGVGALRAAITDEVLAEVMPLQGSALGFRTDKDSSGGYPEAVVKECLIEAVLRGVFPVGNEFNILAARAYITKEGMGRLVREFPGLANLRLQPGVPRMVSGGAIVPYKATWTRDGAPDAIEREIPIRVNAGMGADAILGKAQRKMLAAIYGQLTGSAFELPDGEVDDGAIPTTATATSEKLRSLSEVAAQAKAPAADLFAEPGSSDEANA